ncbi:MAG: glycosyltransferase [Burkholderiales bacterium]
MKTRSVLFLTRALDIGGAQRQLVELASGLHRSGWRVHVLTFYPGGALESVLRQRGVDVACLHKRGRWDVLPFLWRARAAIRERSPKIVHGYLDMANVVLTVLRPWLRGAHLVWGERASNMDLSRYDWLASLEGRVARLLSRYAELVICNSEAGRDYCAAQGYRARRVVVIPNGIDIERFWPDPAAREAVRAEWKVSPGEKLIGLVARLDPMKDHPTFLRAAAYVAQKRPCVRFACVGSGPDAYRGSLIKLAHELGLGERLIWADERADVWRVHNALDIACSSSAYGEGFSNAIAEAIACGVPCVVTDVGDSAIIVGDSRRVCPPRNSEALGEALLGTIDESPYPRTRARERICDQFSTVALVSRTSEVLEQVTAYGEATQRCSITDADARARESARTPEFRFRNGKIRP